MLLCCRGVVKMVYKLLESYWGYFVVSFTSVTNGEEVMGDSVMSVYSDIRDRI